MFRFIFKRYAAPIIHAQVGDETHPPSEADVGEIETKLQDIYSDTEYVTSHLVKMDVLGFKDKMMDLPSVLDHVDKNIENE